MVGSPGNWNDWLEFLIRLAGLVITLALMIAQSFYSVEVNPLQYLIGVSMMGLKIEKLASLAATLKRPKQ